MVEGKNESVKIALQTSCFSKIVVVHIKDVTLPHLQVYQTYTKIYKTLLKLHQSPDLPLNQAKTKFAMINSSETTINVSDYVHSPLDLVVGSLNVEGAISRKLDYFELKTLINSSDIFTGQESWLLPNETARLPQYSTYKSNRKPKKKAKRGSGGILVFVKECHQKGVTREKTSDEKHVIWVKCDKNHFQLNEDIYIASTYFPPKSCNNNETDEYIFDPLQRDVHKYSSKGNILIIGDLNSRMSSINENFTIEDPDTIDNFLDKRYNNGPIYLPKRTCQDLKSNTYGTQLAQCLNNNKLVTLNGRKP